LALSKVQCLLMIHLDINIQNIVPKDLSYLKYNKPILKLSGDLQSNILQHRELINIRCMYIYTVHISINVLNLSTLPSDSVIFFSCILD
jgi:hypothetical protein